MAREAVPDLKDFLSDLYGEKAMTDNQILALLIGSTPSPDENIVQVTEATLTEVFEQVVTTSSPLVTDTDESSDVVIQVEAEIDAEAETIEKLEEIHQQELIHVLNEEIDLIENLKKTEIELKDELRQLEIIKERRAK